MAAVHQPQQAAALDDSAGLHAEDERLRALRAAEARLRALIENEPECVKLLDADGRLLEMNAAGLRMVEAENAEAVLGQCVYGLVAPEHVEAFRSLTERVCRGERGKLEFEVIGLKGTRRWLETHAVPFLDEASGATRLLAVTRDVTERRRLEHALSGSERRFQSFMHHLPAPAWIKDHRLRYAYVNRAYEQVYGRAAGEVVGRGDFELHPSERAAFYRQEDEKILRTGHATQRAHEMPYADGRPGHWLVTKFPLADVEGKAGVAGIAVDITERNRLEEALRASEQRFRAFMQHAPARAWIKDSRLRYTYVNAAFARDHGRADKEFLGRDDFELFPAEVARYFRSHDEQIQRGLPPLAQLRQFRREDGFVEHWLAAKFPLADESGQPGVAGIAFDVTNRVEAESRVRELVGRLVQAQEAERRRVADGLHDLIGQNLTALGIDLQALKQSLGAAAEGAAGARLDAMAQLLAGTIDAVRGVLTDLRPVALEEFGLVPALRWYASQFAKRTGLKASTKASRRELRLAPDAELALFRIAQEALTNAAKHSGGSSVQIRVRYGERVTLTVEDDGRGFAEAGARGAGRGGFGLTTMRERAEAHGGTLRIEFPGRGTRIVAEIPRQAQMAAGGDGD